MRFLSERLTRSRRRRRSCTWLGSPTRLASTSRRCLGSRKASYTRCSCHRPVISNISISETSGHYSKLPFPNPKISFIAYRGLLGINIMGKPTNQPTKKNNQTHQPTKQPAHPPTHQPNPIPVHKVSVLCPGIYLSTVTLTTCVNASGENSALE